MRVLGSVLRHIEAFFAAVVRSVRVFRGFGDAAAIELNRVGLLEAKGHPTLLGVAWRVFYWVVFIVVVVLPTWKEEPVVYFPALFALGAAWLIALPQLSDSLARVDYSAINFGATAWRGLVGRLQARGIQMPAMTADEEEQLGATLPPLVSSALPMALLDIITKLSWRAVMLSTVAILGILVGPRLAEVHWWRSWSPVSILYALPAAWALVLLGSLMMPVILNSYLAARKLHDLEPPGGPKGPSE